MGIVLLANSLKGDKGIKEAKMAGGIGVMCIILSASRTYTRWLGLSGAGKLFSQPEKTLEKLHVPTVATLSLNKDIGILLGNDSLVSFMFSDIQPLFKNLFSKNKHELDSSSLSSQIFSSLIRNKIEGDSAPPAERTWFLCISIRSICLFLVKKRLNNFCRILRFV